MNHRYILGFLWGLWVCSTPTAFGAESANLDANGSLPRATPESQGVSSEAIAGMLDAMDAEIDSMNSIMILRHGKVIAEAWWAPHTPETTHAMYSLSKSFTSTAAGFAATEGLLDIEKPIIEYFPDDLPGEISDNLKKMRVRNVLSMAGGHDLEPTYDGLVNLTRDPDEMARIPDNWAKIFLAHPVAHEPGTFFRYNSLGTYMISAIIQKQTGERVVDYLQPRLFDPLHIEKPYWEISPQGVNKGGSGLFLHTEDMAKFGQFYLQKGMWNGKQLLPAEWIEQATTKQVSNGDDPKSDWAQGYCFQFWRCRHNIYRGDGAYSQFIVVIPEKDAVIVSTADSNRYQDVLNFYWDRLLPAMGETTLPENPEALKRLREAETGRVAKNGESGSDVLEKTIQSQILNQEMKYNIYLPAGYKTSGYTYPVLYLLHGLGDNQTTWCDAGHGNLREIADAWFRERGLDKMIVVMPDAGRTWYLNGPNGRYEDYFFQELIPQIERSYRCKTEKTYRAIAGLSMGGHGSLLYTIHHPEMFQSCYAMSAGVITEEELLQKPQNEYREVYGVAFGDAVEQSERLTPEVQAAQILHLVANMPEQQRQQVRFFIDCGDDDFLIRGNCALHLEMKRLGIPHEFRVRDGSHTWEYWRTALPTAFEFITDGFHTKSE